jgi:hypothetical protein
MMLTTEQRATLKTAIIADNALNALYTDGNLSGLAAAVNAVAQPAFIVWKTSVSVDEIMRNGMDWARVDNLTVGKARIWDWLGRLGSFDASKANVRAGIDAAWVGTAADLAVRASIYTHCKQSASFVEKLFATGVGSDANPATMSYQGEVSWSELVGL